MKPYILALLLLVGCCSVLSVQAATDDSPPNQEASYWERFINILPAIETTAKEEVTTTSLLEKFEGAYLSINGIQQSFYDSLLSTNNFTIENFSDLKYIEKREKGTRIGENFKVFGWHPHWVGDAFNSYNFNLLSHISWFSYSINPQSGLPKQQVVLDQLAASGIVDIAHEKETKVLLTISCFGKNNNTIFLNNDAGQIETAISKIVTILKEYNLDGVDINFENVPSKLKVKFSEFIAQLSTAVKTADANHQVTLTIPKINTAFDISKLDKWINYFILTGYDFHTGGSRTDGPIAPLKAKGNRLSIEKIISNYVDNQQLNKDKLIVALPYYGGLWESSNANMKSKDRHFIKHLTYRNIMAGYGQEGPPRYDPLSLSAYYKIRKGKDLYEKVWFEDTISLGNKFNWIKEEQLAGAGIWALGYDNGHNDLWRVIDNTFTKDTLVQLEIPHNQVFSSAQVVYIYRYPIFMSVIFLMVFVLLGFTVSLFDWRVREYIFQNKTTRLLLILCIFLLIGLGYSMLSFFNPNWFVDNQHTIFITGVLLGFIVSLGVNQLFDKQRSMIP